MENKRINLILKNPNPLFKKWLQELIDDADKKQKKISKTYQKALDSLNKYPLMLYSGHDCAILENFGPKICQLLDERLEEHLSERQDLFRFQSYKDKVSEVQRQENIRILDLIQSVEAAGLIDNTFNTNSVLNVINEENELEDVSTEEINKETQESISQDDEIPKELVSSSQESEDSLDKLIRKYDPEAATKRKTVKRVAEVSQNVIKRTRKLSQIKEDEVVDLSQSPTRVAPLTFSPISTVSRGGVKLKKFKTFDNSRKNLAGPSYASSPISNFLDVETNSSPLFQSGEDEFDKLACKYDFPSPIPVIPEDSSIKLTRKPSNTKLIAEIPTQTASVAIQEEEDEAIPYISIDDINPQEFKVILLVDIQETSG